MDESAGKRFVAAVAAHDADALREVLAPDVDFRGLTPGRAREAHDPDGVVEAVLGSWFGDSDHIDAVEHVEEGGRVVHARVVCSGYRRSPV